MDFIEAITAIGKDPTMEICPNEDERTGKLGSICVYKSGEFVGKLRWPVSRGEIVALADVDEGIEKALEQ